MILPDDPRWEEAELALYRKIVTPASRVLEGGAGQGTTTALLADIADFVVAVEPQPKLAEQAQAAAPGALVLSCALGVTACVRALPLRDEWWTTTWAEGQPYGTVIETVDVPVASLAGLALAFGLDTVLLDVEGIEFETLQILPYVVQTVVAEVHPFAGNPRDLSALMATNEFTEELMIENGPNLLMCWRRR